MNTQDLSNTVLLDDNRLQKLIKSLKGKVPKVRIGVLGDKDARQGTEKTNAEIGAKHEFGLDGMPQRSFLRMPLNNFLMNYIEKNKGFDEDVLSKVIKEGSIRVWVGMVGGIAEEVVQEAFNSGGFGQWKPSNMEHKKVQLTLVETQQLRNSISSEVI